MRLPILALASIALAARADAYVYWTNTSANTNTIGRATLDGTVVNQSFITDATVPYGVAVGGGYVYWTNVGAIGRAQTNGNGVNQVFINNTGDTSGVAVDSNYVYWSDSSGNTIGRANIDGTGANRSYITATGGSPQGLAVTATDIYWASQDPTSGTVTIFSASLDDPNSARSLVTGLPRDSYGVAVGPSNLYWTSFSLTIAAVGRANLDGTSPDPRFITASTPNGVAVDAGGATCGGGDATIIGTGRPDKLKGTNRQDVIAAGGGDDAVVGLGGDDVICGGGGDDELSGRAGDDTLTGGKGEDELRGNGRERQPLGWSGRRLAPRRRRDGRLSRWGRVGQRAWVLRVAIAG